MTVQLYVVISTVLLYFTHRYIQSPKVFYKVRGYGYTIIVYEVVTLTLLMMGAFE